MALLAFSTPYELLLLQLGPLQVSSLELLLGLTFLSTAAAMIHRRRSGQAVRLRFPRRRLLALALLAPALLLSAALAPEHGFNAFKASARLLSGVALALCIPQLFVRPDGSQHSVLRWLALPLVAGGAPAAILGLWEVWQRAELRLLAPFREAPTFVGPFIRLTGPFEHANQAGMFFEATTPIVLAVALTAYRRRAPLPLVLSAAAVLLWLQAIVSTYGRTAVVAMLGAALFVAALRAARHLVGRREGGNVAGKGVAAAFASAGPWAALAAALLLLTALNTLVDPVVRLRMRTEGDNEWYNLRFEAPGVLQIDAGHMVTTTVTIHNLGELTWSSAPPQPIYVGGHWLLAGSDAALGYSPRWLLPRPVAPGEAITMALGLRAPLSAGEYRFRWDMIHEGSTWFSYKNGDRTWTEVTVAEGAPPRETLSAAEAALGSLVEAPPDLAPIPARRVLWRIAAQEFLSRPALGIGLDNFRLMYGRALDYEEWNDTIHTNNWYIEILTSLGIVGALPYFLYLALLLISLVRALLRQRAMIWHTALAAALVAFLLHGLLDYFLASNATGLLFWMLNGWWVAIDR